MAMLKIISWDLLIVSTLIIIEGLQASPRLFGIGQQVGKCCTVHITNTTYNSTRKWVNWAQDYRGPKVGVHV